jgi:hypothetical protein
VACGLEVVVKTCHGLRECGSGVHQIQTTGAWGFGLDVLDRAAVLSAGTF